jgi:acyl carrier protein
MATCAEVGLDPLAVMELSSALMSRLGIQIQACELQELSTVGRLPA